MRLKAAEGDGQVGPRDLKWPKVGAFSGGWRALVPDLALNAANLQKRATFF
jgi:hypothetical protein